jgi:acyl carrier protein
MPGSDNRSAISTFLLRHIRKDAIEPAEDIFAAGYVNSLFALQLIQFVEKAFAIQLEDEDLEMENFRSVAAIEGFVRRKRDGRRRAP